ncbi:hypothetical protein KJZ61_04630, partial [Candidatus Dependentiae bacterium]|nr:hypothetical protein [Candidatus Dependentiae bacterium]
KLEQSIEHYEHKIKDLEEHFAHLVYGSTDYQANVDQLSELRKTLATTMERWEHVQQEIDLIGKRLINFKD